MADIPRKGQRAFFQAGDLFKVARSAYEQAKEGSSNEASLRENILISIVFSAAALEAFINEATHLAETSPESLNPPAVKTFAVLEEEVEESRGQVTLKFLLAKASFTGQAYDKGKPPYQDFKLLMDLRNDIMHLKPTVNPQGEWSVQPPKSVRSLVSKGILGKGSINDKSWFRLIGKPDIARWAYNVAAEMVQSILKVVPKGSFKSSLDTFYGKDFQPIN